MNLCKLIVSIMFAVIIFEFVHVEGWRRRRRRRRRCSPTNCSVGLWGEWTPCSAPCGYSGTKSRVRVISSHAQCGGSCLYELTEQIPCNRGGCHGHGRPIATSCWCVAGWTGVCCSQDINECAANNGGCAHTCRNTAGSFTCGCRNGYSIASNGKTCIDINECAANNGGCAHTCHNTAGSFTCGCRTGYRLASNGKSCTDIDECAANNGGCAHTCQNSPGSFTCGCRPGYSLASNGKTCTDINDCSTNNGGCDHTCQNTDGSFICGCMTGYRLTWNRKSCM
ncbi:uncharacterized protein LOC144348616, partial [Saccoglossus kowalevskii]